MQYVLGRVGILPTLGILEHSPLDPYNAIIMLLITFAITLT